MRRRESMMQNWLFTKLENTERIDLPHTWNAVDGQDGGNDYFRGTCIYEKKFVKPEFDADEEEVFIEFEGVNASASVYLNNKLLGSHDGGYSTFRFPITNILADDNTLRVEVDNSINDRVYPQKADFTFYGGIYRAVNLLILNRKHFLVESMGASGIHVIQQVLEDGSARVDFAVEFDRSCLDALLASADSSEYTITASLLDINGQPVEIINRELTETDLHTDNPLMSADGVTDISDQIRTMIFSFDIAKPHLWQGISDPYLYTAVARLNRETEVLDEVAADFGIRTVRIDPKWGFYLNGVRYPLHGVSRHQDRKGIGNAISCDMMEEDLKLILEVGANSIRLAHYQHNQYFYDLCDRYGILVWAEIPYISGHLKNGNENTIHQMQELIIQNYNHPCIYTWGLSNEITINWKDSFGACIRNHKNLNKMVHEMDPGRPTSMACYAACTFLHPVTFVPDVIAWNLYLGWYVPGIFFNDWFISLFHCFRSKKPLGYSEYGAEGMPNLHSAKPKRGDNSEEYQAYYHEKMLECFDRHESYMWCTYVWNMFDFAADARNQGGEPGMNHKGLMTFDRKIRKDAFYIYKAWWSSEPFVHICSKRYERRSGDQLYIKAYSNLPELTLYANGKKFKVLKSQHVFEFTIPDFRDEMEIRVEAGQCIDKAVFTHVDVEPSEYSLKSLKGASANWM